MKFWYNFNRVPLDDLYRAVDSEVDLEKPGCAEYIVRGIYPFMCTRKVDHAGRHIAQGTNSIFAAWPGDEEPTLEDLTSEKVT